MDKLQSRTNVPAGMAGQRFDQILPRLFHGYSRAHMTGEIKAGRIRLDGRAVLPRTLVHGGEEVEWNRIELPVLGDRPEPITLSIVFEDADLLVVDKPAGLVVHPGAGNRAGTLLNALLHHDPELVHIPRAGIVHRLDKDTSGLLVVARSLPAHTALTRMLAARDIRRRYAAIVNGVPVAGGTVDAPLDRHPSERLRRAVREGGRPAVTHYRVHEKFRAHALLRCELESGRTHQIRVHMAHAGWPLVGDPLYGKGLKLPRGATSRLADALRGFKRQALHAERLAFGHPVTGEALAFDAEPPRDFLDLVDALREDARS
ncbi:MAG TPA: 23S rRNA pseudouridine(1911/1915/1917) synthase RluD [Rhodanobacteraceae bacterium]|nr:23S rRNA pseudouridine(1911/1915/1917) synthase RluD [Rhodanobacteraceae bacterium]